MNKQKVKIKESTVVALWKNDKILLVQRAQSQNSGKGLWQLPGGKVDADEQNHEAILREAKEELDIDMDVEKLHQISGLSDEWIANKKNTHIHMSIFYYEFSNETIKLAEEFSNYKWFSVDELTKSKIVFLGSTFQYITIIFRYLLLGKELEKISQQLSSSKINFDEINIQILFFLQVMGLVSFSNNGITNSSDLSGSIIDILSEWTKSNRFIFEPSPKNRWKKLAETKGDLELLTNFNSTALESHKSLLAILHYRLSKASSHRKVTDLIITSKSKKNKNKFILLRWDFLARKFQVPSRGLEDVKADIKSLESVKYVMEKRLGISFHMLTEFDIDFCSSFETAHLGAGSLSDGSIMRTYEIGVFRIIPNDSDYFINTLNLINQETEKYIETKSTHTSDNNINRNLNFYVWVDLETLKEAPVKLLGHKVQGFDELMVHSDLPELFEGCDKIKLDSSCKIPIIGKSNVISNYQQFKKIINDT